MRKSLVLSPLLFGFLLTNCGATINYLKPGDTNTSGNFTQRLESFTYQSTSQDGNSVLYELSYLLHSKADRIIALGDMFSYLVKVDDGDRGGISLASMMYTFPNSIAPNQYVKITLVISCLRDWGTMVVSYTGTGGISYSFGIKRSDYPGI